MWALLIVTLPSQPNAVRLRIWRSLKALGCAALRDGAYLLPIEHAPVFEGIAAEVNAHGGSASVMALSPRDDAQRLEIMAQFDRGDTYAAWRDTATLLQATLPRLDETDARRRLRGVADALEGVRRTDYYPSAAAAQAEGALQALRQALDARFSKGEPHALSRPGGSVPLLARRQFQAKRWATRARPWVDRLACAWLIRRFIDPQARFVWLADGKAAPRGAIGFDYDGARFTHVGAQVSFEVLAASFGLAADAALRRIASAVHYLDVGGIPVPEAAGLEAVLSGLRELHTDDNQLVAAAGQVFDALYAGYAAPGTTP
jgi:hypothetical protein